ncbi:MAG: T9SS type A sorting domain-containing protein [Chitinophagales bacterium]
MNIAAIASTDFCDFIKTKNKHRFTSVKPAGQRKRGDWGGLVLLGYATVNWPGDTGHIEGIVPNPNTLYGGGNNPNDLDNSGTLQFVRIEFAGIALSPNNEINGLTFGGVGSGTTIDHIQVSYSNDDSYEFFGGTVNCKYLIAYDGIDDDFDTDNGYVGKVQFAVGMRDPNVADVSGSKTFESDNDPTGSANTPITAPTFQNVTGLGGASVTTNSLFKESLHHRRNTKAKVYNSIMMGFPLGILIDGSSTIANCANNSEVKNSYVQQSSGNYISFTPASDPNEAAANANLTSNGNVYSTQYSGVLDNPDFPVSDINDLEPASGNPLPSADNSLYVGGFWTSVSYIGAFNPNGDTWAGDWTNFDPVNTIYPNGKIDYSPTVTTNTVGNTVCPNTGAIDINVSGGVAPYSYVWSNGATTQDLSGITNGSYTVTVFDEGGLCSVTSKKIKVGKTVPILLSCSATSTSITVTWSGNIAGFVSGYQLRYKKNSVSNYGPWIGVGNGFSYTVTGLLPNTQYNFQLRGICASGNTGRSATLTCSTTLRLAGESSESTPMNIFPNPSQGEFTINLNGFANESTVSVSVTDVLGKEVYSQAGVSADAAINMNLNNLTTGVYNVTVSDGSNRVSQKISITK